MNVILEDVAPCRKRLTIEVPSNRVQSTFERVAADFQKEARLPGFRPGHAPKAMVVKKYQKDIENETQRVLVPEAYQEAIKTKNLKIVSAPEMEDIKYIPGMSLSFSTVIDLEPEFRLPTYKGLVLKKQEPVVTDEDVDTLLNRLADQRASFGDAPERPLEMGDFAVISYTGTIDGQPIVDLLPKSKHLGHNPNFWLWMRTEGFIPGFAEQIVGLNRNESKTLSITFPSDYQIEELAGKTASYDVSLTDIKVKIAPAIDEAFAQDLAKSSLEDLKVQVRKTLESDKKEEADRKTREEIVQKLIESVHFEMPQSVVDEETDMAVQNIVSENQSRGIPAQMLQDKKDEIFARAAEGAREVVKFGFLASRIAEAENIKVTREALASYISHLAERENMPMDKLVEQLRKNNAFGPISRQLERHLVLEFLVREAKFEE